MQFVYELGQSREIFKNHFVENKPLKLVLSLSLSIYIYKALNPSILINE